MSNLVLTRRAGQGVRLIIDGEPTFVHVTEVCGGYALMAIDDGEEQKVRFRSEMRIAEGVSVLVIDLARGHAKLNFTAPREVAILRTELIKETEQ